MKTEKQQTKKVVLYRKNKQRRGRGMRDGIVLHGLRCEIDLGSIDGRTRLGKAISWLKKELQKYADVNNIATELLINQIVYKAIKLNWYAIEKLKEVNLDELPHFLPMSNSLRLDLQALAQLAGRPEPLDLESYLRKVYGNDEDDDNNGSKG